MVEEFSFEPGQVRIVRETISVKPQKPKEEESGESCESIRLCEDSVVLVREVLGDAGILVLDADGGEYLVSQSDLHHLGQLGRIPTRWERLAGFIRRYEVSFFVLVAVVCIVSLFLSADIYSSVAGIAYYICAGSGTLLFLCGVVELVLALVWRNGIPYSQYICFEKDSLQELKALMDKFGPLQF